MSEALGKLCTYVYKPSDALGNPNKVDFLACWEGLFLGIECKQVPGATCAPSVFTQFQKSSLWDISAGGGIAIAAVNFNRGQGHTKGIVGLWNVPALISSWPTRFWLVDAPFKIELSKEWEKSLAFALSAYRR